MISLNAQLNVGRQVFFCSLGGFDTHSGQSYQQWDLLQQVSQALDAFYAATVQLGVAQPGDQLHAVRLRPHAAAERLGHAITAGAIII